jgi:flavin-dependent dehydrogenase
VAPRFDYDAVILGGGMAGMTAALQLRRALPSLRVAIVEKRGHPVPEAAFKVGESVTEICSLYLRSLGLTDHLREEQLSKMGLRFFCTANGNEDITQRIEYGLRRQSPIVTYQLDRGRFENCLAGMVRLAGAELLEDTTVTDARLSEGGHVVTLRHGRQSQEHTARWVIDASGRAGILRRDMGLHAAVPLDSNAAWFRVADRIRVDDWSKDQHWRQRVPSGTRWLSTCHLVGEGYWVWLIPLSSGCTSVGIVADPRNVPFETLRRYGPLRNWLSRSEPQLARLLPSDVDELLDFRTKKHYAYGCQRLYSHDRWALTGEAGLFLDPLYSVGADFIAMGNTLLTRLVEVDLSGGHTELRRHVEAYNTVVQLVFANALATFQPGQLRVFGNPQTAVVKVLWDYVNYFMVGLNLYAHGCITDPDLLDKAGGVLGDSYALNVYMQNCLQEWSTAGVDITAAGFPSIADPLATELFTTPMLKLTNGEALARVQENVGRLRSIATDIVRRVSAASGVPAAPLPPPRDTSSQPHDELLDWTPSERRALEPAPSEPQSSIGWWIR